MQLSTEPRIKFTPERVFEAITGQGGTLLQMTGEVDIPGLMAEVMGKLFFGAMKKAIDKDHEALKDYVEKGAK